MCRGSLGFLTPSLLLVRGKSGGVFGLPLFAFDAFTLQPLAASAFAFSDSVDVLCVVVGQTLSEPVDGIDASGKEPHVLPEFVEKRLTFALVTSRAETGGGRQLSEALDVSRCGGEVEDAPQAADVGAGVVATQDRRGSRSGLRRQLDFDGEPAVVAVVMARSGQWWPARERPGSCTVGA